MQFPTNTQPDTVAPIGHNQPPLNERLAGDYVSLIERRDELTAAHGRTPTVIDDAETAGKIADFIKQTGDAARQADKFRVDEKQQFLDGGRTVDGFFKTISEPLLNLKKQAERVLVTYQRMVAEAERKAREEAECKAREEAARLQADADARAKAADDEQSLNDAIEAEDAALAATAIADDARQAASVSSVNLTRTHSDSGVASSMSAFMNFKNINPATIDLEKLRLHFSANSLDKAVRSMVKSGVHDCRGVDIFEDYKTNVR